MKISHETELSVDRFRRYFELKSRKFTEVFGYISVFPIGDAHSEIRQPKCVSHFLIGKSIMSQSSFRDTFDFLFNHGWVLT